MIYTDGVHLTADTVEELHRFAELIGLNRCWFHNSNHLHYDLMKSEEMRSVMLEAALSNGAQRVSPKMIVKKAPKKEAKIIKMGVNVDDDWVESDLRGVLINMV